MPYTRVQHPHTYSSCSSDKLLVILRYKVPTDTSYFAPASCVIQSNRCCHCSADQRTPSQPAERPATSPQASSRETTLPKTQSPSSWNAKRAGAEADTQSDFLSNLGEGQDYNINVDHGELCHHCQQCSCWCKHVGHFMQTCDVQAKTFSKLTHYLWATSWARKAILQTEACGTGSSENLNTWLETIM